MNKDKAELIVYALIITNMLFFIAVTVLIFIEVHKLRVSQLSFNEWFKQSVIASYGDQDR